MEQTALPAAGGRGAPSRSGVLSLGEIGGNEVQISEAEPLTVIKFSGGASGRSGSRPETPGHQRLVGYQ